MTRSDELNTLATRAIDNVRAVAKQAAQEIARLEGELKQHRQWADDNAALLRGEAEGLRIALENARTESKARPPCTHDAEALYTAQDMQAATLDGKRAMRSAAISVLREYVYGRRWLGINLDALADQVEAAIPYPGQGVLGGIGL